ncbi:MAG: tRNA dihydrouridine synthase DusB [Nitrospirae bacterium]|nr:tRNA dihydrouridine synthase DusB [Nitrospirota bacterium]
MLKIGDVTFSSRLIMAPLSGISDLPFRMISRFFGCKFAFSEMISCRSLISRNKNTLEMLSTIPSDMPLGIQLLGNDSEYVSGAMELLNKYTFDIIDFNAACPVSKVTSRGEGASLLKEPRRLRKLLRVLVENTDVPVTVKIRSGWDNTCINAGEVALYAQDSGIKGLFIHGRTREQGYKGLVDYRVIREVKEAIGIPVIAGGDALSPQLIKKMFDETGCDGVAIARGSLGNPWIFDDTEEFLRSGVMPRRRCRDEIIATMIMHLNLCSDYHGEMTGVKLFRKFFVWYTKGFDNINPMREKAFRVKTKSQMMEIINELTATKTDVFDPAAAGPLPVKECISY